MKVAAPLPAGRGWRERDGARREPRRSGCALPPFARERRARRVSPAFLAAVVLLLSPMSFRAGATAPPTAPPADAVPDAVIATRRVPPRSHHAPGASVAARAQLVAPPAGAAPVADKDTRNAAPDPGQAAAPSEPPATSSSTVDEITITLSAARSVSINRSIDGVRSAASGVGWTRSLGGPAGPGLLRGRLLLGLELTPALVLRGTERTAGFGLSPIRFRWLTEPAGRLRLFMELNGGILATATPIPRGLTRFNFTAEAGGGLRIAFWRRAGLLLGYRLHHLSNGNRLPSNPSINSHMIYAGISVLARRDRSGS